MSSIAVYALGFLAQGFFSARMLIQWIMSERARKIVSPNIYWICSLAGSILLFIYGWLRNDFSIIFGQFISYYIYIWNLNIKGVWPRIPVIFRVAIFALPLAALCVMFSQATYFIQHFLHNSQVPLWLLVFGSAGQFIFTIRYLPVVLFLPSPCLIPPRGFLDHQSCGLGHHRGLRRLPPRSRAHYWAERGIHHLHKEYHVGSKKEINR